MRGSRVPLAALVTVPAYGDRSEQVRLLQYRLKDCYGFDLDGTGYYGDKTRAAIRQVQEPHGIHVDGVYGPATMKAMNWRLHQHTAPYLNSERCYSPF